MQLVNRNLWENYLKDNHLPFFMRNVQELDYVDFKSTVETDLDRTQKLITDTLEGDVFILRNVFSKEEATAIKNKIYESGKQTKASDFISADTTIPNYHTRSFGSKRKGYYNEVAHAYYYYRWNPDDMGIFDMINESWDMIKVFNGLGADGLKKNVPADKVIDRIQVLHYPINAGGITTHTDAARWQITNFGVNLTEKGIDFDDGGFYCLDQNENEVDLESYVKTGDGIFWSPSIFHGVKTPTGFDEVDWGKESGRWQLITQAVQSEYIENRRSSVSYEKFNEDPMKIKEDFMFREMNYG
jgi:hypothetical protein